MDKRTPAEDGLPDVRGVRYNKFGVIAIKAIQEQQLDILDQQKQVDELRQMVRQLTLKNQVTLHLAGLYLGYRYGPQNCKTLAQYEQRKSHIQQILSYIVETGSPFSRERLHFSEPEIPALQIQFPKKGSSSPQS